MGFEGQCSGVAVGGQQLQAFHHPGRTLAGQGVGGAAVRGADGVLDVDVDDVRGEVAEHVRGAVAVRDAVAGVEQQPQGGAVHGAQQS